MRRQALFLARVCLRVLPVIDSGAEFRHFGDDRDLHVGGERVFRCSGSFTCDFRFPLEQRVSEAGELDALALAADRQLRFERLAEVAGGELLCVGDVVG